MGNVQGTFRTARQSGDAIRFLQLAFDVGWRQGLNAQSYQECYHSEDVRHRSNVTVGSLPLRIYRIRYQGRPRRQVRLLGGIESFVRSSQLGRCTPSKWCYHGFLAIENFIGFDGCAPRTPSSWLPETSNPSCLVRHNPGHMTRHLPCCDSEPTTSSRRHPSS